MRLPLPPGIADRLASGALQRLNPDGTPYTGNPALVDDPVPGIDDRPSGSPEGEAKLKNETRPADEVRATGADPDELVRPAADGSPAGDSLAEQRTREQKAREAEDREFREPPAMPSPRGKKSDWVAYVTYHHDITEEAANDLTRDELAERYGSEG